MNLCQDKHDEICFEGHDCPMCAMRDDFEHQIMDYKSDIERLKEDVTRLEDAQ